VARIRGIGQQLAKRFYQIAIELGMRPRAFISELSDVGLSVGNQMVIIPEALEERIREMHTTLHAPPKPEPVEEPVLVGTDGEAVNGHADGSASEPGSHRREGPDDSSAYGDDDDGDEGDSSVATATDEDAVAEPAPEAPPETEAQRKRREEIERKKERQARRAPGPLIPTLDPRAGRLVKDAPAHGLPSNRPAARARPGDNTGGPGGLTPNLPNSDRAPGARRDGARRETDRYRGKRGKETFHMRRRGRGGKSRTVVPKVRPTSVDVEVPVALKRFCELTTYKAAEIIRILFKNHGMMVTPNSVLDKDTVELLSLELEIDVNFVTKETAEDALLKQFEVTDDPADLVPRPPVVAILGHVDHGKTTLLDYIRSSDVAGKEAGGITQHIGASKVTLADGREVTFLDTPGHEAFTSMRARGANITDVVILIVAADDGVMPQTIEAISHAKAAEVTIVVAITKVDRDNARVDRVKGQLAEYGVFVEGYGGDVSVFEVSGITGQGVPELLDHLALMAEVDAEHFRANPDRRAQGTVIEAQNSPTRGIVTTVLVENGTLKKGDPILAGESWGRVRSLFDDKGATVKRAGPSTPVEVIGLDKVPDVGVKLYATESTAMARKIGEARRLAAREAEVAAQSKPASVESLFGAIEEGKTTEVNLVVKADVKGSLEPLKTVLGRLGNDEVRCKIIHAGVGAVNESDVVLASASNAWVIGFHVNTDAKARARAKQDHVEVRSYKIIYDIEHDVRDLLEGRLAPELIETPQGKAEVLAIFTFSKVGNIAGCRVREGFIKRDAMVRVRRGEEIVHDGGKIATLRREKDTVTEVREGLECGLTVSDWDELEIGDVIETHTIESKRRTF
jgi:translation initiation factor IF-2